MDAAPNTVIARYKQYYDGSNNYNLPTTNAMRMQSDTDIQVVRDGWQTTNTTSKVFSFVIASIGSNAALLSLNLDRAGAPDTIFESTAASPVFQIGPGWLVIGSSVDTLVRALALSPNQTG